MGLKRKGWEAAGYLFLAILASTAFLFLGLTLVFIISRGASAISWEFLTTFPRRGMTEGGVLPALVGTFLLVTGAMALALPVGVGAAIFLVEFGRGRRWAELIRVAVDTMAGVPSIVYGLFGFAVFVKTMGLGICLLSGIFTLALLSLPPVIRAAEEALRAVPEDFRYGAYALGATPGQALRTVILPIGLPGILTGAILAAGRAAGETAPIMFTAVTYFSTRLPSSPFDEVMALPFHLYTLATEHPMAWRIRHIQFGTALVLLELVFVFYLAAAILRARQRRRKVW